MLKFTDKDQLWTSMDRSASNVRQMKLKVIIFEKLSTNSLHICRHCVTEMNLDFPLLEKKENRGDTIMSI